MFVDVSVCLCLCLYAYVLVFVWVFMFIFMFDCFCLLYVDLHHQGLERQGEETPEEKIKAMEKRVGTLWFISI